MAKVINKTERPLFCNYRTPTGIVTRVMFAAGATQEIDMTMLDALREQSGYQRLIDEKMLEEKLSAAEKRAETKKKKEQEQSEETDDNIDDDSSETDDDADDSNDTE